VAWKAGQSGNAKGRPTNDKTFAEALRIAVNEPDETTGKKNLRMIAEQLVISAKSGEGWAIQQVADRLDGKPAQESTVTFDDKRDAPDWTTAELLAVIDEARNRSSGSAEATGSTVEPDKLH